ncbi:testis-expressed protein 13A-like [Physeter macrocephalus]|uniref:Testis-expressed protein 13A-like n=1 Tax=Physeter macrocephalus TaxID=9755 RepID=A0A2Y9EUJ0_PHYMC|nr:testis-expressed protein 13A-like [Physeter catodon]|eukprot:XP_007108985.1 testis-expressed protein 13A-like [Physeter catodon]
MAVNFNDPACGFLQREVVDFLNKQIRQAGVSPYFSSLCESKSWGDMEKKLRDIVTNSGISGRLREACAWSSLALAVRFAERQKSKDKEKIKKLQEQLEEQKLLTNALRGTVNRLRGIQEREKEKAQSQLQQSLTNLHRVEEERNLLRSELLRVLSSQSQQQARTQGEEKEKEAQTSGMLTCSYGTASCWLRGEAGKGSDQEAQTSGMLMCSYGTASRWLRGEAGKGSDQEAQTSGMLMCSYGTASRWLRGEAGKGSDQETAAAPGMAALGGEAKKDKVISLWGNNEVVANFSCPQFLGAGAQAGQLLPLNLSQFSYSYPPTVSLAGATGEAAAAPPVKNSRTRWDRKHSHTRKFLPETLKQYQYPGVSHSARRTIRRRMGDWDCAWCHSMNFLWRTMCFKCKKSWHTRESRGSPPN